MEYSLHYYGYIPIYIIASDIYNTFVLFYSSTYERVTANAENLWRFERYTVVTTYRSRIPSPLNLISFVFRIRRRCRKASCCKIGQQCKQGMILFFLNCKDSEDIKMFFTSFCS